MSNFDRNVKFLGCPHCGSGEFSHSCSYDDGDTKEEEDIPDTSCPGCGDLDPWSYPSNRRKFYSVGNKENAVFIRQLERKDWEAAGQFCIRCRIVCYALRVAEDEAKDKEKDLIKVRVNAKAGSGGLIVGHRKDDRVELFVPSVTKKTWLPEFLPAIGEMGMISATSKSKHCLDLLKEWLRTCRGDDHPDCPTNDQVKLPSRVIDVGSEGEDPKLVETNGQLGEYLALSYCWGGVNTGKTLNTNLRDRLIRIPLNNLCTTHLDAIDLTRRLGFRYLWIDALCIVQDDSADWTTEAAKMWEIYRDSALTIAADSSKSGDGGIYSKRRSELIAMGVINIVRTSQQLHEGEGRTVTSSGDAHAPKPALSEHAQEQRHGKNANIQNEDKKEISTPDVSKNEREAQEDNGQPEGQTSRDRVVGFSIQASRVGFPELDSEGDEAEQIDEDLMAECAADDDPLIIVRRPVLSHKLYSYGLHTRHTVDDFPIEDRAWCFQERILSTRIAHFNRDELVWECNSGARCECGGILSRRDNTIGLRERFEVFMKSNDIRVRCDSWMDMVCKFYRRQITNGSDRLAALSGLAHCLSDEGGFGEYAAGIWKAHLPFQLLWSSYSKTNQRVIPYRAPTWTFTSLEITNGVSFLLDNIFPTGRKELASVKAFHCVPAQDDNAGYLSSASLTLTGPARECDLHVRFPQGKTSAADACFMVLVNGKLRWFLNDISLLEETKIQSFEFREPGESDLPVGGRDWSNKDQMYLIPFEIGDAGVRRSFYSGSVTLLAICTERQLRFKSYGYAEEALYLLVLRETTAFDGSKTLYERIGAMQLNKEGDSPDTWLADAKDETITII